MQSDFEVEGKGIEAASLAEELARRVKERGEAGVYSHEVESLLSERLPGEEESGTLPPIAALDYSATLAKASWEVTAAYPVSTEKRFLKPFVIFFKRLARLWARIAVGPIQREQTSFNRHAAGALDALRRQAIAERAQAIAAEEDLASLVEPLIDEDEDRDMAGVCVAAFRDVGRLLLLGPCPRALAGSLAEHGYKLLRVSAGTAWDEAAGTSDVRQGPLSFLSRVPEGSQQAMLIPELAFWLRPEALLGLARRAYLVLAGGGAVAVTVHGFAGSPAPAWCDAEVVKQALKLAGFKDISVVGRAAGEAPGAPSGYVAVARK